MPIVVDVDVVVVVIFWQTVKKVYTQPRGKRWMEFLMASTIGGKLQQFCSFLSFFLSFVRWFFEAELSGTLVVGNGRDIFSAVLSCETPSSFF